MDRDYLRLAGRVAIVTGGARGIGEAIASALARFGARVAIADIKDEGEAVAEKLKADGFDASFYRCDVASRQDIEHMTGDIIKRHEAIDILINNAGIGARPIPFELISDEEWDRLLSVDLTAPFHMTRAVAPYMKKRRYGKIINISSGSGIIGCEFCSHYAAAKAGLIGFTQSIAKELAPYHINVNAIAVPTTATPMLKETGFDADMNEVVSGIPWGRIGTPEDIADMALYLASDASEYVTGQVLAPNGGRRTPI